MDTRNLVVGSRIAHGGYGAGVVTFVGETYLGISFDDGGEALIQRAALEKEEPIVSPQATVRAFLPWPDSTFVAEAQDAQHYLGSHWEPFAEDVEAWMLRLPQIVQEATLQAGYGEFYPPPRSVPDDWPKGFLLTWPPTAEGMTLALRVEPEKKATMVVSLFPSFSRGSQCTLTLHEVCVWESGVEAQITASWNGGEVTFFDSRYPINRAWYEAGKQYEFILTGIAYGARPAEKREWKVQQHPEVVAWSNRHLQEGEAPHERECTVRMDGAAMLLSIDEWDVDDYSFHAPVKSVEEFKDWLGQDGWRVRATVMRCDEDCDLDILITRRAWSGEAPPQVGQDIEGRLWLQGYLWMAGRSPAKKP